MDLGHFQRLGKGHIGHDGGDAARQHGLARAGRADEQQVMPAADGDFEGAAGDRLAFDEGEVELARLRGGGAVAGGGHGRQRRVAADMVDDGGKAFGRHRLDAADVRRLARVARGHDEFRVSPRLGGDEDGQDARQRAQPAVQRQLAQKHGARALPRQLPRRL